MLLSKIKGRLENLEEGPLMEHATRQLGETLVANCLLLFKLWKSKELAKVEALQVVGLKRQVTRLTLEVDELWKVHQETKTLLFGKSQEALGLYVRNNDLRTEVERLKRELDGRDEQVARKKEELAQKVRLL